MIHQLSNALTQNSPMVFILFGKVQLSLHVEDCLECSPNKQMSDVAVSCHCIAINSSQPATDSPLT